MRITETIRFLRRNQTEAEKIIWENVRNKKLGEKIVRQKPIIFKYENKKHSLIADFYCSESKLIIEIDGKVHDKQKEYDEKRTEVLNFLGYKLIRFNNEDVFKNLEKVLSEIKKNIKLVLIPRPLLHTKGMEKGRKKFFSYSPSPLVERGLGGEAKNNYDKNNSYNFITIKSTFLRRSK